MPEKGQPLNGYYAIIRQTGEQAFSIAVTWPQESPDVLGSITEPFGVICLFSTFPRAEEFRKRIGKYPPENGWEIKHLDQDLLREFLESYSGRATEVSLDPGAVLLKSQPFIDFLADMSFHIYDPDKE